MTTFPRSLAPRNLLTVPEFSRFARALGRTSWEGAARHYAMQTGGALVMRADGSLVCFVRSGDKVRRKTHKPNTWRWA